MRIPRYVFTIVNKAIRIMVMQIQELSNTLRNSASTWAHVFNPHCVKRTVYLEKIYSKVFIKDQRWHLCTNISFLTKKLFSCMAISVGNNNPVKREENFEALCTNMDILNIKKRERANEKVNKFCQKLWKSTLRVPVGRSCWEWYHSTRVTFLIKTVSKILSIF